MADINDEESGFRIPSLKDMWNSMPAERAKAFFREIADAKAASKNAMMVDMAERNKKNFGGPGGLEQITPDMTQDQIKEIADARAHLERLAGSTEMGPAMGRISNLASKTPNAAQAIQASRAVKGPGSVTVIPDKVQDLGKVLVQNPGESYAQALLRLRNQKF